MVSTRPQKEYRRSNAGLMSPMAKPNKASQKSAPYSASAKKAMANKMLNGASVAASKAKKPVYWALSKKEAAKLWGVAKAGAALWWVGKLASKWAAKVWSAVKSAVKSAAKWAVKAQSVKNATKLQNKPQLNRAEPYYDRIKNKTLYSNKGDVRIGELPRKAKRK